MLQSDNALFLYMLSFLQKYFHRRKERAERHHRWKCWLRELKLRTDEQFLHHWAAENLTPTQRHAIEDLARIMELPTPYLFPADDIFLILYNTHADFRDVEAMQAIEKHLHIDFPSVYEQHYPHHFPLVDFLKIHEPWD
ncbi:MAG: hypothetical protein IJ985_04540 [Akkermansia sp.]|nr:hypothetical protein [Akkermansia sp.]